MLEPDPSSQAADIRDILPASEHGVIHNLNYPVVLLVANGGIAVPTDFVVELRHGRRDGVGMDVASSRSVLEADDVAVLDELNLLVRVVFTLAPCSEDVEVVVVVLVMVACNLLLG